MKYAALMFDIVDSRRYRERYDVQKILIGAVNHLNILYRDDIKKDVVSSAGDEFQGLFYNLQAAFLYIRKLQLLVYPINLRCGIGYGEIKYDGIARQIIRLSVNGLPAIHGHFPILIQIVPFPVQLQVPVITTLELPVTVTLPPVIALSS